MADTSKPKESRLAPTPITDYTHAYVAQKVIAFCAAFVDANFDPTKTPAISTDELISMACKHFGLSGVLIAETFHMREGYLEVF